MTVESLSRAGAELAERFATRDPFAIAEALGIQIMMNSELKTLKGAYFVIDGVRWILINSNLSHELQRIVCAHELGHDQLHREIAEKRFLLEYMLCDTKSRPEYEANVFAAELLLPDSDVLELIYGYSYSAEQIARCLNTDVNLVALKCDCLRAKGCELNRLDHKSNFLK